MEFPFIEREDTEIYKAMIGEEKRQAEGLELIPSENYVSRAVKEAIASSLTNKYSEAIIIKKPRVNTSKSFLVFLMMSETAIMTPYTAVSK